MIISIQHRFPSVEEYIDLCRDAGSPVPFLEIIPLGLAHSLYAVCAMDDAQIVGMARVVGDGATIFEIADVAVRQDHQRRGIGRTLMEDIFAWLDTNAHATSTVRLIAPEETLRFYEHLGFIIHGNPVLTYPKWNGLAPPRLGNQQP